jgi:hypothetical protein
MLEFLEGFEKRMQIVAIVESIVNRRNRNMEIEKLFKEKQFENVVLSVLVFIMDKTLSEDSECNIKAISGFLFNLLPGFYDIDVSMEKATQIAEYIIKNVLQNEGLPVYFPVMNYETGKWEEMRIKLIDDKVTETDEGYNITYILTDQGYDFLFRTKEVDGEISFSVEEFKLRELIKRKNYKKALQQSINLVQMIRQKKKDLHQFMLKIRENIYEVDISRYEELINSTYDLLNEEYQMLGEIMNMVKLSEQRLHEEYRLSGRLGEDIKKAQREIAEIKDNLSKTLSEQKDLIISRQSLSRIYVETIKEAFSYTFEKRFDFEEEVLRRLERCTEDSISRLWQVVNSLFLPNAFRHLNVGLVYEPQGMLKLDDGEKNDTIEQEEMAEDREKLRVEKVNRIYTDIIESIITLTIKNGGMTRFSRLIEHIKQDEQKFRAFTEDRLVFTTVLKLYDMGHIDVLSWRREQEDTVMNVTEEFSLEYCLAALREQDEHLYRVSGIRVSRVDDQVFSVELTRNHDDMTVKEKIEITDFMIRVDREDGTN